MIHRLIILFLLSQLATITSSGKNEQEQPNVILLIAEDLSPNLACYGNSDVATPHIDSLAQRGIRLTNAFATSSVCSPSRSAIFTGVYQTSIDSHHHRNLNPQPLPPGLRILPQIFKDAGYYIFNGNADNLNERGKMDVNFSYDEDVIDGSDWRNAPAGQPFFGMIQFEETHRDFAGDPIRPIPPEKVVLPPYYPDHPLARQDWSDYLEDIQILDRKVGSILRRIQEDGLDQNTIIVFVADHGRPMPRCKQFLYDGGVAVPLIFSWPGHLPEGKTDTQLFSLIDLLPTCIELAGLEVPSNIDGRALLSEDSTQRAYIFTARDRCGEAADRIRMIRSKTHKLIRNFHPVRPYTTFSAYKEIQYPMLHLMRMLYNQGELNSDQAHFMQMTRPYQELYDIQNDPHEIDNLIESETHADEAARLSTLLNEWIAATNDAGAIPEDYGTEVEWYLKNQRWYRDTLKERGLIEHDTPSAHVEYWENRLLRR